jgi:Na+-translocating ferredoxin:NAD+ oxidoreductase RnfA subunit
MTIEAEMTQYIVLLIVSVGLTFLVGRLLVRAGEPFLLEVFHDRKVTRSVNLLLSVLFHLITLGVLAIISVADVNADNALQTFIVKLGVVLLTLGLAYGISMLVLVRVRERRRAAEISEHVQERLADRGINTSPAQSAPPAVAPPPGQPMGEPGRQ